MNLKCSISAMLIAAAIALFMTSCARHGAVILENEEGRIVIESKGGGEHKHKEPYYPSDVLKIPKGHMPPPGKCRIWYPDRPPGHQPPPDDCENLKYRVPKGAWLIHG